MQPARALFTSALATLAMACGVFIGLSEPQGRELPPLPPPSVDPCVHTQEPTPPDTEDDGPDLPPFWLALRHSYIGASTTHPDAGLLGFDLDGTCTCDRRPSTAFDGGPSCVPRGGAPPACDYDGGIDNSVEQVFSAFTSVFDPNKFVERVEDGRQTVLIYIAGYNGRPNDLLVKVGFVASNGIYTSDCDPSLAINDNPPGRGPQGSGVYAASWRGCDKWHGVPEQFVGDPSDPATYVPKSIAKGFVRNGVLVMHGETDVPVFFNEAAVAIQYPILVAPLSPVLTRGPTDPARFEMKGAVLAGRVPLTDVARVAFTSTYDNFYTCQNMSTFTSLMSAICVGVDLSDSVTLDHQGKTCSAMSFAFRFDADVADLDRADHSPIGEETNPCLALEVPAADTLCPP
jgi:hypothetical protein